VLHITRKYTIILMFLALSLISCSLQPEKAIMGMWAYPTERFENSKLYAFLFFRENGIVSLESYEFMKDKPVDPLHRPSINWKYVINNKVIVIHMENVLKTYRYEFNLAGTKLVMVDQDNGHRIELEKMR